MNQTASHSQTPKFDKVQSQTTQILYQPPTKAEIKPKSFIKDTIHNIVMALVVVSIMSGLTTACFYAADKEAEIKEIQNR